MEAEDIGIAREVLMMVQYVFTGLSDADSETVRIKQLQLLTLLQVAFGTWHRVGKRAEALAQEEDSEEESEMEIQRAGTMRGLCLDLGNRLMSCMQLPVMDVESMGAMSEMFAGGPIIQCELPGE